MSTMKPGSDLGEKIVAPPCYAGEPVVEERFIPKLGRSIKVYPADVGSFTKKEEYGDGYPRVLCESGAIGWVNPNKSVHSRKKISVGPNLGFCGVNPRKSVISRLSHIENTKKVAVGRRMRSGCKVHYLRRRQKILAKRRLAPPSVPNKFLFSPSPHALEMNMTVVKSVGNLNNLTSLPPRGILYETSCIEAKTEKSEGLDDDDDDGSPPKQLASSVEMVKSPISYGSSDPEDDEKTFSSLASCIEEINQQVEFLKEELAKPYTSRHCLKGADRLFSWIPKTGALPPYKQVSGECWAAALQRGRAYAMAANGIEGKELTIKGLLNGVSRKHLNSSGGLVGFEGAKEFLVANGYVKDFIVHRRPLYADADELACYESLLEKLLARSAVVVVYNTLPGYGDYEGEGIYIPEEKICEVAAYEKFKQHSAVVTGCGVSLVEEKLIEFWQTHDSQGPEWGVDGFGQLARGNGLIVAAVEFEF